MKAQSLMKHVSSLLLASGVAMASSMAAAEDRVVNVYNWSDYVDEEVLKDFEKETGIKVKYDVFDSNEVLETKLLAGATGYDVVVPSASFAARQIQAGVFSKLDKEKIPNLKNAWDAINQRVDVYDKGNEYLVNYLWGTTGIGYVKEKVEKVLGEDAPLDSWSLVFDPKYADKLKECGIHWLDAPTEVLPAAMAYVGLDGTSTDKNDLKKGEEVLQKVRSSVKKFHSSEYISALANGDICVAIGWSGDVLQARDRAAEAKNGVTVDYIIPKEGALMWFDMMAIPSDAKNVEEAYAFIDFMMRADSGAKVTNYVNYANGNKASQEKINKDIMGDARIYPSEDVMANLFPAPVYGPKFQRLVNRSWTRIKSGK